MAANGEGYTKPEIASNRSSHPWTVGDHESVIPHAPNDAAALYWVFLVGWVDCWGWVVKGRDDECHALGR